MGTVQVNLRTNTLQTPSPMGLSKACLTACSSTASFPSLIKEEKFVTPRPHSPADKLLLNLFSTAKDLVKNLKNPHSALKNLGLPDKGQQLKILLFSDKQA